MPETLIPALDELEAGWARARPTPLSTPSSPTAHDLRRPADAAHARRALRARERVYLKREDLLHTGAHKINNTLGQACSRGEWASSA